MVVRSYYESEWMEEKVEIDILKGLSLEDVYNNIIRQLIPLENKIGDDIDELIALDEKRKSLEKEIIKLEGKIKREKQFNKKVDLNIELQKKKRELECFLDNQ